jgi:alpha-galactosidase
MSRQLSLSPWFSAISALAVIPMLGGMAQAGETTDRGKCDIANMSAWSGAVFVGPCEEVYSGIDWLPVATPPFSFVYDGKTSQSLLPSWKRTTEFRGQDRTQYVTTWLDAKTGLKITAAATAFHDFPAVEWVLRFENTGTRDTPILENVQALDIVLKTQAQQAVVLDQIRGDDCSPQSFLPMERPVKAGESVAMAPVGGRPSDSTFPFFNLDCGGEGLFTAIGWTGQWAAKINRAKDGSVRLQAGMELTHLRLRPGEAIRTPRIMLMYWSGDRIDAHNRFRRLLMAHYQPKLDGKPIPLAISVQTFNRTGGRGYWASEPGQLVATGINRDLGCDSLWLDAGWFEGDFSAGVGNWFPKTKDFPRGLRPVGDACGRLGLKFLVWYEPEDVKPGTKIAREHPAFILPVRKARGEGGLFDLGNPQARRWMTDLLIRQIAEFNIHTYRNDFNMAPLEYWRQNDPPDRQGISEIRYVEGLYVMWDEMRAKYPHMYLDDCASGGRRIDLEMLSRAVVQTQSDFVGPGRLEAAQCQNYGLNLYLPLHATISWDMDAYACRSTATAGFCGEWDILDRSFPFDDGRAGVAEIVASRKYWYGDFYPLTPCTPATDAWIAWQLDRPDLDEGLVLAFRRKDCRRPTLAVKLRGLKPEETYAVTYLDDRRRATVVTKTGRELGSLLISLSQPRSSVAIRYAPQKE